MKTIQVKDWREIPKNFTGIIICSTPTRTMKLWSLRGMIHRLDGPAIERGAIEQETRERCYYVLGEELTKEQFEVFQFIWENALQKKTQTLMRTFVKLVKVK